MSAPAAASRARLATALAGLLCAAGLAAGSAGCLRSTTFTCAQDADCTGRAGARCEAGGVCSFPDGECPSGFRFGDHSGGSSGRCVGDAGPGEDAAIDTPTGCPATYTPLTGVATHVYRVVPDVGSWIQQQTTCMLENAYLVEPDDAAELQAVNMAASAVEIWIGLSDQAMEGTFVTSRGGGLPLTPVPWENGEPDNAPSGAGGADCVRSSATGTFADDRCLTTRRAVCECEP